ncbi:MAG: hypothetical protein KDK99_06400 [Verrucomicrobiales bacterium]|nr:hypothetical protein [Verrucomicrobiales bacterium]
MTPYKTAVLPAEADLQGERSDISPQIWRRLTLEENTALSADPTSSEWSSQMQARLDRALEQPADGLMLAGWDSLNEESAQKAALQCLEQWRADHPDARLALELAAPELPPWLAQLPWQAFLIVGVTTYEADGSRLPEAEAAARLQALQTWRGRESKPIYAVEFARRDQPVEALTQPLVDAGIDFFITPPGRPGLSIAPLREVSRRVLVLFGWDPEAAEKHATWPVETMTAELFQTPLEILGYEADYFDIGRGIPLPPAGTDTYAAVLLDAEMDIPARLELPLAQWLIQQRESGVPVLFTGSFPFQRDDAAHLVADAFHLGGSLNPVHRMRQVEIVKTEPEVTGFESPIVPRSTEFRDLTAPEDARVWVDMRGIAEDGTAARYHPVFLADWGGMWMEPCIILRASADNYLFYVDPTRLLSELLGSDSAAIPAPDATTRDGRRLFYTHIDGDGFASRGDFPGHPFCARLIRDEILQRYRFPVTVSIVEADIRGLAIGIEDGDIPEIQQLAREIFALPQVQAASHSFSHPYQWDADDPNPGIYDEPFMPLKLRAKYTQVDPQREIQGSIAYINNELLPPEKRVELMLWSGNCRPGVAALRACRQLGIENMNGGNTIVSRLYPGTAGVAPRVMPWGEELQIHAANQNEFMYTNGWNGPFYGGFADVVDTFERTETPRRTKPVNVYYHFYSASSASALHALHKILDWCVEQPLHPVTATNYARIVRDAYRTRCHQLGHQNWLLTNAGDCRCFRLPAASPNPDLASSVGITGWTRVADALLIHTDGRARIQLKLLAPDATPTPSLRLADSTAEISHWSQGAPGHVEFQTHAWGEAVTRLAGISPGSACQVRINQRPTSLRADDHGFLTLTSAGSTTFAVDVSPSSHAARN